LNRKPGEEGRGSECRGGDDKEAAGAFDSRYGAIMEERRKGAKGLPEKGRKASPNAKFAPNLSICLNPKP
jgi:hypothetical protein